MKWLILLISIFLYIPQPANAVVSVNNHQIQMSKLEKPGQKITHKRGTFKSLVGKLKKMFDFDLSDSVDGWLSWAILFFAGAIVCGAINWLVGGIYLLGLFTTILALLGLASFVVYVVKLIG